MRRTFTVVKSNPKCYNVKCDIEGCPWRLHAFQPKWDTYWKCYIVVPHTCAITESVQSHRNLSSGFIADEDINPLDTTTTPRTKQEFKLDTFWNPIRSPEIVATSNMHNFHIRSPFEVHEYLMESLSHSLSNSSSLTSKFLMCAPQSSKESVVSPVWAKLGLVMLGPKGRRHPRRPMLFIRHYSCVKSAMNSTNPYFLSYVQLPPPI